MECPKCGGEMEKVVYESVEVDRCAFCGGLWFDEFEEKALRDLRGAEAIDTGPSDIGREYNKVDHVECPVCHTQMTRMVVPDQSHIWYESCPVCYGVFFDAGEFKDHKRETLGDWLKNLLTPDREQ